MNDDSSSRPCEGYQSGSGKSSRLPDEAKRLIENGRFEDAADLFAELGARAIEAGRFAAGIASLRRGYELDPSRIELLGEIGKTHHQLGRFGRAFDLYAIAVDVHRVNGNLDAARGMLKRMSRLEPKDALRHAKLAELLAKLGKQERAVSELESCTDQLLHEENDIDGFLQIARRILALDPEYDALRRRILELIVAEGRAFIRYKLHDRAERLLETAKEHTEGNQSVREALAELFLDSGDEARAVRELVELARLTGDEDEQAMRYLRSAAKYTDEEELQQIADELDLEVEEFEEEWDEQSSWEEGSIFEEEDTDPQKPTTLFRNQSTVTDREPVGSIPDDGRDVVLAEPTADLEDEEEEPLGREEYASDGEGSRDTVVLPSRGKFWRLLALMTFATECQGETQIRIRSTGHENLGSLWIREGRIVPCVAVDESCYVDDIFRQRSADLVELFANAPPTEVRESLADASGPWGPSEIEPVRMVSARAIAEILDLAVGEELVASRTPADEPTDAPTSFSPRSIVLEVASRLAEERDPHVEGVYSALVDEELQAWLLAPGHLDDPDSLWLPVRATTMGFETVEHLVEIARVTRDATAVLQEVGDRLESRMPIVSVLMSEGFNALMVRGACRACIVEVPPNRLGAVLATVRTALAAQETGGEGTS